ncbi:uncharacterized protein PV07_07700 [Cladophialophora immunda]|uniref:Uncharacterized protein n=1 Tax=Cladophialophora immunda TaxID=569365 RepID=A0A0D2CAG1_9EURO|nr:uncharacterized protein PV07_07700 [Cladophialophora immunda]KIW28008.1 hypothetical protein PV07_07700 [Cladophialophora immunda]
MRDAARVSARRWSNPRVRDEIEIRNETNKYPPIQEPAPARKGPTGQDPVRSQNVQLVSSAQGHVLVHVSACARIGQRCSGTVDNPKLGGDHFLPGRKSMRMAISCSTVSHSRTSTELLAPSTSIFGFSPTLLRDVFPVHSRVCAVFFSEQDVGDCFDWVALAFGGRRPRSKFRIGVNVQGFISRVCNRGANWFWHA